MIKSVMLAWYGGFESGGIGDFLNEMQNAGFFSYVLPFLLIFALVFGILTQIKIFKEHKSINGVIAFVVGLMALQFDFVPIFFAEIFPRLGVGLAILLLILIFVGIFSDPDSNAVMYTLMGVGMIIAVIVLISTAGSLGWSSGYWWYDNWKTVAVVLVVLAALGIIVGSANPQKDKSKSPLARALRGEG